MRFNDKAQTARRPIRSCLAAFVICLWAGTAEARSVDYNIDQTTATIAFGTQVANVVPVDGNFRHFTAHIQFDTAKPSDVNIEVVVDDSKIDVPFGGAATLRSAPYFDTAKFPTIRFHSDSVQSSPDDHFTIAGNLTIRDVSRPQILTGVVTHTSVQGVPAMRLVFHSRMNRTDFGMVADRPLIADAVTLTITTVLRAP
ncbi:YceI family protein [Acidisoma cellulosilytica]|uniref:YceI family protein n=1 Tax=Acidisoma cellulosilyticum TaxID=2802395 RepID=A0A963YZ39_9PROT|nr:YceI family protein [Acidisoma cellulosilyticum]MCB8879741.1 YceI family protein [Acidisoma cellulosilyticum]